MKIYVMTKFYNSYGGHVTLSPVGDFLMWSAPDFGDGINEITVTLYFPHTGLPKKTLENSLEVHNRYRKTLPKVTFYRNKRKAEIEIGSELLNTRDRERTIRLPLFKMGVDEVTQALSLLKKRLKNSDAFDFDAFINHCEAARDRVPKTEDELQELAGQLKAAEQARLDAMDEWEKLDIDWEDYHPEAKEILNDPFYWECSNDFAPNGNDSGADLLHEYRDWLKKHRDGLAVHFLELLAKAWGYTGVQAMDELTRDESIIGLAFAEIKLRAKCDDEMRKLALQSIELQRKSAEAATDWPHRQDRLKTLEMLEKKLKEVGT